MSDTQIKSIAVFNHFDQKWSNYQPVVKAKNVYNSQDDNFSLQNVLFPISHSSFIDNNYFLSLTNGQVTNNNNFLSKSFSSNSIERYFRQDAFYSYDIKNFFVKQYEGENYSTSLRQLIATFLADKVFLNGSLYIEPIKNLANFTSSITKNVPLFDFVDNIKSADQYAATEQSLIDNFFLGSDSFFKSTILPSSSNSISPFPVTIVSYSVDTPLTILATDTSGTCYLSNRKLYLSNTFSQSFENSSSVNRNFYRIHFSIVCGNRFANW